MSPKKSLLILSPGFPGDEAETDCIPALQLFLEALNQRGIVDIQIISFHYPYQAGIYQWQGITVYALGGANKQGIQRILRLRKTAKIVKEIQQTKTIDFIHSFWLGECAWIGNQISKKFKIQHFCTLMGQDALASNKYLSRIYPLPKIITLSNFHSYALTEHHHVSADFIIPWGVKNEIVDLSQARPIDVLGVGNFITLKNFQSFVRIIEKLKEKKPDIKAVLIGRGEEKEEILQLIQTFKLQGNIKVLPQMSRKEVLQQMSRSKCLLHCSTFESFGMVVIEALSQGASVLAKNVGIAAELDVVKKYKSEREASNLLKEILETERSSEHDTFNFNIENTVDLYLKKVYLIQ